MCQAETPKHGMEELKSFKPVRVSTNKYCTACVKLGYETRLVAELVTLHLLVLKW